MTTTALIVAAGKGLRMGGPVSKQFISIGGRTILAHTLAVFDQAPEIDRIVLVIPEAETAWVRTRILDGSGLSKPPDLVAGGRHRQDSVYHGLCHIPEADGIVLIHDGVRPFVTPGQIAATLAMARETGACILALPLTDTLKETGPGRRIRSTLDRTSVWAAQTPQTFHLSVIRQAHQAARRDGYIGTDDARLVERMGQPVSVVPGSRFNIKITTPDDLILAKALLAAGRL